MNDTTSDTKIQVRIPATLHERLVARIRAADLPVSLSALVRVLLERGLDADERRGKRRR
jgi:predicted HicB family RNase H-like nuclease